jgi:thiosulfate/3-mercaptopyruvate sulfurtransferase
MDCSTLIEAAELESRLGAPELVIVDCRYDLFAPEAGAAAYARGHIPGASFAHMDRDLANPITPASGRHPLPSVADFEATLRRWGVSAHSQVIVYDESNGTTAGRLWWMLRWVGHPRVALLNGGWKQWLAHGGAQSTSVPNPAPGSFRARADQSRWVTTEALATRIGDPSLLLVDARAGDRYAGRSEPIDAIAGHVPGALHHPLTLNLDGNGHFLPAGELRARWEKTLAGRAPADLIAMCGSGVSACHNLLALEIAGLGGGKLYVGSWSEWIRDRGRPVATSPT